MINYSQISGGISIGDEFVGTGYSGFGPGLDNPALEDMANLGPIPRGEWRILRWDDEHGDKGPVVAVLAPNKHDAHGRSGFLIHGDNSKGDHSASHGCIIAGRLIRQALRASGEMFLEVI